MAKETPDLGLLDGVVAQQVLDAMRTASQMLTKVGVRHSLVGGLAVGAYGFPRATKDVDFLVGDEAFEHHGGGIVTMKPGLPVEIAGVVVDFLSVKAGEEHLGGALSEPHELQVAPAGVLAYLKLKSPRAKDRTDLIELVKAGFNPGLVRDYLTRNAVDLLAKWDAIVADARTEEEA